MYIMLNRDRECVGSYTRKLDPGTIAALANSINKALKTRATCGQRDAAYRQYKYFR